MKNGFGVLGISFSDACVDDSEKAMVTEMAL